ncbi:hypothetical protein [Geobacillus sp. TFV-3]|uniref:hypothetical protein n=1 Tax=Geobacillus sp. TFV-3 TaxID=1897059 RepID=UPI001357DAF0|nr:hypothetical protein [Geobacillus sp. TFV-3]KAF0996735.1 hypothetical protein BJQ97_03425 [Geobacillus sp. TFV-3]
MRSVHFSQDIPIMYMAIIVPGGPALEGQLWPSHTAVFGHLIYNEFEKFSEKSALNTYGGKFGLGLFPEYLYIQLNFPTSITKQIIRFIFEFIYSNEYKISVNEINQIKELIIKKLNRSSNLSMNTLRKAIFGECHVTRSPFGTLEDINNVTTESLRSFWDYLQKFKCTCVSIGAINPWDQFKASNSLKSYTPPSLQVSSTNNTLISKEMVEQRNYKLGIATRGYNFRDEEICKMLVCALFKYHRLLPIQKLVHNNYGINHFFPKTESFLDFGLIWFDLPIFIDKKLINEISNFIENPGYYISQIDFERAKNYLEYELLDLSVHPERIITI